MVNDNSMIFDSLKIYPNGLKVGYIAKYDNVITRCNCGLDWCYKCNRVDDGFMAKQNRTKRRIKSTIRDYVLSNDFKYFVTFTFKDQILDRETARKKVSKWLDNYRQRKNKDVKCIMLFERHKKGGWHIHALFDKSVNMELTSPFVTRWRGNEKTVHTFNSWRFGFSRVEEIEHKDKISTYILKYITKDVEIVGGGKNNYIATRNLNKPLVLHDVEVTDIDFNNFEDYEYCVLYKFMNTNDNNLLDYI